MVGDRVTDTCEGRICGLGGPAHLELIIIARTTSVQRMPVMMAHYVDNMKACANRACAMSRAPVVAYSFYQFKLFDCK